MLRMYLFFSFYIYGCVYLFVVLVMDLFMVFAPSCLSLSSRRSPACVAAASSLGGLRFINEEGLQSDSFCFSFLFVFGFWGEKGENQLRMAGNIRGDQQRQLPTELASSIAS